MLLNHQIVIITMQHLSVLNAFKSYKNRPILRGVSISVSPAEIIGILGPNGAGKTSLFYGIIGLTSLDKGQVIIDDHDISNEPMYIRARRGIGYLPQESSIFRGLNVEDNIKAVLENEAIWQQPKKINVKEKITKLLQDFGIEYLRYSASLSLSGGERRRLEIARTLATEPRYILLDEPFSGVDPIAVNEIRSIIYDLKRRNIGIIITDHNVRETLKIVDRAYVINEGNVIAEGTKTELVHNKMVTDYYFGHEMTHELMGHEDTRKRP